MLCQVAARLRRRVRAADTLARLGGDEFAVLVERLADPGSAQVTAQRVIREIDRPIVVPVVADDEDPVPDADATATVRVTASIGIVFSRDDPDADAPLRQADAACHCDGSRESSWRYQALAST
ncbi:diguanylate cyclase domain-containing protein [Dactylosporangium sp. CA-233914]|uniref:diguanylate cyclase domain-containing protein n=1 Tax=Dactylosporangium sp. CA-233914 TaxID=3239934 RepID=UPI003D8AA6F1